MENQQLNTNQDGLIRLAKNAKLGDGCYWKHPECKNYKLIFTSVTPKLLELKQSLAPNIFSTGVKERNYSKKQQEKRYNNAKQLYRLASKVNSIFTKYKNKSKIEVIQEFDLIDFALWYLDDGCLVKRNDSNSYRVSISIGNLANTPEKRDKVIDKLQEMFGDNFGRIYKNNSKATENNKTWYITKQVAKKISKEANKFKVLQNKIPPLDW